MSELFSRLRAARLVAALLTLTLVMAACGSETATTEGAAESSDATDESDDNMADEAMEAMDDEMDDDGHSHSHGGVIELPDGMDVPDVGLRVSPDPISGLNVFVDVKDFTISPENASTEPVAGEGHLHLYIDGVRQMRFYNTALHIDGLSEGEHEIMVEVSANNHSAYAIDGEAIRVSETVTVAAGSGEVGTEPYEAADAGDPSVTLEVTDDPKSGWNLFFGTTNLDLSPETAGTDPVPNEGHLNLIVDGENQGRIYGQWWHLKPLPEGDHEVVVQLVANNGAPYLVDGEPVEASASVTVTAEQAEAAQSGGHGGDDDAMADMSEDENIEEMEERGPVIADANLRIEVGIEGDQVTVESDRFQVPRDFTVTVVVESDRDEQVHVHGYDFLADVGPGSPAEIIFEADIPGVFEVELEESGLFLFEIAVVE